MASAVVLAAGGSRRMGSPKALLPLGDSCLLAAHLSVLSRHISEIYVVGGALYEEFLGVGQTYGARTIRNLDWQRTMPMDSLRLALSHGLSAPCVVTPVDTAPVSDSDLVRLLACSDGAVLTYEGSPGHPVLLGPAEISAVSGGTRADVVLSETPGQGLRDIVKGLQQVRSEREECLFNFNTPEDWRSWLARS